MRYVVQREALMSRIIALEQNLRAVREQVKRAEDTALEYSLAWNNGVHVHIHGCFGDISLWCSREDTVEILKMRVRNANREAAQWSGARGTWSQDVQMFNLEAPMYRYEVWWSGQRVADHTKLSRMCNDPPFEKELSVWFTLADEA